MPLPPSALRVGAAVPCALRDAQGLLLLAAGSLVESEAMRQQLLARGVHILYADSERFQRALAGRLTTMLHQNVSLGRMARVEVDLPASAPATPLTAAAAAAGAAAAGPAGPAAIAPPPPATAAAPAPWRRPADPVAAWQALALRAAPLLREPAAGGDYPERLRRLDLDALDLLQSDVDLSLLVLAQLAGSEAAYSVLHALWVAAIVELAARELPDWPADWRPPLRCAALTMNLAMTTLQDQLSQQTGGLLPRQRLLVQQHPQAGADQLRALGVDDALWLAAVASHHVQAAGPLAGRPEGERLGRLIQRADVYTARLSPRKGRPAQSATAAARAAYLGEDGAADEAGAAVVKAMGLYPPGCAVQLASGELALVLRRGPRADAPRVASLVGRSGNPLGDPVVRDTRVRGQEVKAAIPAKDLRVRMALQRLVAAAGAPGEPGRG
ncbi:hypothetical protein ISF6_0595 [Piscinibacter sakaiensis]|uniref:HD-GYP domain-containing protein n=1 Tax=Piscinibacter sakaiensis TaxID=1547922 RepID=A0A0K8NYN1_PISS1|nr:hypothetical protein ISF6_0595 [Piscinibacter sakaiensis]